MVLGNNGIINKAKEASTKSAESSVKEKLDMTLLEYSMYSGSSLENFLNSKKESGEIDSVTKQADGTFEVEKDGYIATVNANGTLGDFAKAGPRPAVSGIKVVANTDGSGENVPAGKTDEGTPLYITFTHSIEGGTTTVSPSIPFKVTANGTYNFTVTGTVNGETSTKAVSVTVNQYSSKYKIGDLVNYTPNTEKSESTVNESESGTSEQKVAKDATLKWRILNIDEAKGTVDLVSATPTSSTVKFYGALGYHNGPYIMNKICEELYSNSTLNVKARNINLLDMEKHLTPGGIAERNKFTNAVQYGNTKTYTDNYSYYPLLYAGQKGAGVNVTEAEAKTKITQPNTDAGNDPYEESVKTTSPLTSEKYTQADKKVLTVTQTYYSIPISPANYGDAASVLSNSTYYWVAARYVDAYSDIAYFGLRLADTNTNGYRVFGSTCNSVTSGSFGLRPVVSLPSSILSDTKDAASGAWNLK